MSFTRLEMLFLIWAAPALFLVFVYGMKRRRKILNRYAMPRGLGAIAPESGTRRRWIKAGLILATLCFLILALTGPRYGYRWEKTEHRGVDIIVALDCSKSMLATDIQPRRLDRAKREVLDLLNMLKGDRVGLVAFSGTAFLQCPLTVDYETFHIFINALTPDFLPVGGTDLNEAIATSLSGFNKSDNTEKAIILITDGENTGPDALDAARKANSAHVKIFAIGVGGPQGVPVPGENGGLKKDAAGNIVMTRLDEATLKQLAAITGGAYVRSVAGDMDLEAVYLREIREKMDLQTLQSGRRQVWNDRYQWFLAAAVIMLIMEMFLPVVQKALAPMALVGLVLSSPVPGHALDLRNNLQKGLDAYEQENYDAALTHFIAAQLKDPDRPEIFYNIGNAHYKLGDFEAALKNYQQALESEDAAIRQKATYNSGNAGYRLNQLTDALARYQTAVEMDPADRDARLNLEFVKKKLAEQQQQKQQQGQERGDGQPPPQGQEKDSQANPEKPEQSKKDRGQDGSQPGANPDNPDPKDAEKGKSPPEKKDGEETSDTTFGSEAAPGDIPPDPSGSDGTAHGRNEPAQGGDTDKSGMGEQQEADAARSEMQAERILDRLEDMPGRAMIPSTGSRRVDKDW